MHLSAEVTDMLVSFPYRGVCIYTNGIPFGICPSLHVFATSQRSDLSSMGFFPRFLKKRSNQTNKTTPKPTKKSQKQNSDILHSLQVLWKSCINLY